MLAATAELDQVQAPLDATGPRVFRLDLPSRVGALDTVEAFAGGATACAGLDSEAALDVQIAVHEAVLNAIVHGNRGDESRRVRLEVEVGSAGLEVRVEDQGCGFDPSAVPDPLAAQNLSRSCGRGLLFMRSFMDEVVFRRTTDGGTQVRMFKRRARR